MPPLPSLKPHCRLATARVAAIVLCGLAALTHPVAAAEIPAGRLSAIAMHGAPKLAAGFTHFPYVNPDAPKGGRLRLGMHGTFDSLNPLIVRGAPAAGIRDFQVETLMTRGLDEAFTMYPLIAESVEMPADRSEVTFHLNPAAHFSDGHAITADDVIFSWDVLRKHGRPNHRAYYKKVARAERLSERSVRFVLDGAGDREMPLILAYMPVLARHATDPAKFEETTSKALLGSGPYTIADVDLGRSITYRRDPNYWGKDLPVSRGRFNFDEIRYDYFREANVLLEAFKSGSIDLRVEDDPALWTEAYNIAAVADGKIVREAFDIGLPAGMNGLVFNTRRPVFSDKRVRAALIRMLNFQWLNRSLYVGLYRRTESFFARSSLASTGRPADEYERRLLAPYLDRVDQDILEGRYRFPDGTAAGQNRDNQRAALEMLKAAGYELKAGRLVAAATGQGLTFEILTNNSAQERLLASFVDDLARIGIRARVRRVDSTQYQSRLKTYDYDMIQVTTWSASLSPGNEQYFRYASSEARKEGTYNYAGVADTAVDAMIAAMLAANGEDEFVSAVRALDRVLLSGAYVIPLFHLPSQWVAYWARIRHPAKTPLFGYVLDAWWSEPESGH